MSRPCNCDNCPIGRGWTNKEVEEKRCYDCWRFHNVPKYHVIWGGKDKTLLEKAVGFMGALAKHAMSGFSLLDDGHFIERIKICETCPFNENWICKKCGCSINIKARWQTQDCPEKKWPKLNNSEGCGCGNSGQV